MGQGQCLGLALHQSFAAGNGGNVGFGGHTAGGVLVTHQGHGLVGGADELDVAASTHVGEMGILGQEAVAGMDGLNVADLRRTYHPVYLQIAVAYPSRTNAIRLIRQFQVGCAAIGLAEDGDRLDTHLAAGAKYPQGDLTSVGNQNSFEHCLIDWIWPIGFD